MPPLTDTLATGATQQDLKGFIAAHFDAARGETEALREEMRQEFRAVRTEMREMEARLRLEVKATETRLQREMRLQLFWFISVQGFLIADIIALTKLFL